jgi:F-type H+-transporting ATPase subunit gamma
MPNLRDIKQRIKSIQKTEKLTSAMKMVASARLRRAEQRMRGSRYFNDNLKSVCGNLDASELFPDDLPLIQGREQVSDIGLIVVSGERGLCGSFNNNLIQHAAKLCDQNRKIKMICLGKKGLSYFTRHNYNIIFGRQGIIEKMDFAAANELAHEIIDLFNDGVVDEFHLLYYRFQSMMVQRLTHEKLIPLELNGEGGTEQEFPQMLTEPGTSELLQRTAPFMIASQLYNAISESAASEQAARRMAMENASDNAQDLVKTLTMQYNRTRQSVITTQILEVVAGSEGVS